MTPHSRRTAAVRTAAVAVAGAALLGGLSGCAAPDAADGRRVAEWVGEQEHVLSASSWVSEDPWSRAITIEMDLDPRIDDADLLAVTADAHRRARDAGWHDPVIAGSLGDDESYSDLGGRVTIDVFLALRGDPGHTVLSARGDDVCGGIFCMEVDSSDPAMLHAAVLRMLEVAADAGGVQSNLTFTATSSDGLVVVTAQPEAPIDESVALLERLEREVPVVSARAWPVQPVGDLPPQQILDVTVADAEAVALAEALAREHPSVELRAVAAP